MPHNKRQSCPFSSPEHNGTLAKYRSRPTENDSYPPPTGNCRRAVFMGCNQQLHSPGKPNRRCACYLLSEWTDCDWETWEKTYINGNSAFTSHVPITLMCQINVHLTEIQVSLWNLGHSSKFKARSPESRIAEKNVCKENKHQRLKLHTVQGCQKCNFFLQGKPHAFMHPVIYPYTFLILLCGKLCSQLWEKETNRMLVSRGLPSSGGHMG